MAYNPINDFYDYLQKRKHPEDYQSVYTAVIEQAENFRKYYRA